MLPSERNTERSVNGTCLHFRESECKVWKTSHLHSAGAAVECRGSPSYLSITVGLNVDMQGHIKHPIITTNKDSNKKCVTLNECSTNDFVK